MARSIKLTLLLNLCFVFLIGCNRTTNKKYPSEETIQLGDDLNILVNRYYEDSVTTLEEFDLLYMDSIYELFARVITTSDTNLMLWGRQDPYGYINNWEISEENSIVKNYSYKRGERECVWSTQSVDKKIYQNLYYFKDTLRFLVNFNDGNIKSVKGTPILSFGTVTPISGDEAAVAIWETAIPQGLDLKIKLSLESTGGIEMSSTTCEIKSSRHFVAALNVDKPGVYTLKSEWTLSNSDSIMLTGVLSQQIRKE